METEWRFNWANPEEFEKMREESSKARDAFVDKWKDNQNYLENVEILKEALDEYENLFSEFKWGGEESYYYALKQQLNQADANIRQKLMLIEEFARKQAHKTIFFEISLSKMSEEKQKEFLDAEILNEYKNFLKGIFENSNHILSEKEEKILSLKSAGSFDLWVQMVEGLLSKEVREVENEKGEIKKITYNEMINLMRSKDKKVRESAREKFEEIMAKYEEIAEVELNAVLENAKVEDELRGFTRADESRIKEDDIDFEFIDSLLEATKESFSIGHKYFSHLAKLAGEKKIGYHERNVNVGKIDKKYSYEEAVELVKNVFSKMNKEFVSIFENMLDKGLIDAFPKPGKNGGAFCISYRPKDPIHVLLNHTGSLRDVTTLAHEMGHAINDHFMQKRENALNFETPKATAEVSSIFMEDFVFEKVLSEATDEEKFALLFTRVGEDIQSVQRQIALYLFELEIHKTYREEGYLSKEKIGEIFVKHMAEYMGESVTQDTTHLWWIYWGHIRMYFYVYSYASGTIISKALQKKYREDNSFIEKIKEFLSTGKSKSPREIFEKMDITINKEFFLDGFKQIENDLDEAISLGKKLGKF